MAILPPNFRKDAIASIQGWRHPKTNELLKAQPLKQSDIDEYNRVNAKAPEPVKVAAQPEPAPVVEEIVEEVAEEIEVDEEEETSKSTGSSGRRRRKFGSRIKAAIDNAKEEVKDALD